MFVPQCVADCIAPNQLLLSFGSGYKCVPSCNFVTFVTHYICQTSCIFGYENLPYNSKLCTNCALRDS